MSTALPRRFHLQRDTDISGVSGTGRVADGILWPDGTCSLRWRGDRPSTVHWDRIADAEHVHGHGGATRIVWDDPAPDHIGGGANAEDCPACWGTNPPYPFICPGHPAKTPAADEDAHRTARRRNSILNLLDRIDRHGTLTPEERALLRNHVVDEGLEHDTARARAEQAEERAERAAKRTEEHRRLAAHRLTELEQVQARVRLLTADIKSCTAQQWPQRLAAAEAAIKRVQHVAALIEAGAPWTANQHETARRILAALDGTEQPTTEA